MRKITHFHHQLLLNIIYNLLRKILKIATQTMLSDKALCVWGNFERHSDDEKITQRNTSLTESHLPS